MKRQRVKPKLLVGLTSSASQETLNGCMKEAEGIIIPTGFAPITAEAQKANDIVGKAGGFLDLHSAAAWENAFLVKAAVEAAVVVEAKKSADKKEEEKLKKINQQISILESGIGVAEQSISDANHELSRMITNSSKLSKTKLLSEVTKSQSKVDMGLKRKQELSQELQEVLSKKKEIEKKIEEK